MSFAVDRQQSGQGDQLIARRAIAPGAPWIQVIRLCKRRVRGCFSVM
jgi:hypothetical protein